MGVGRQAAQRLVEGGVLDRLAPGVFAPVALASAPLRPCWLPVRYVEQRCPRRPSAVVTGQAALAVYGVAGVEVPPRPVVRTTQLRLTGAPFMVLDGALGRDEIRCVRRLPVAGIAIALADLAQRPGITERELRMLVDRVRWRRLATIAELAQTWSRMTSWHAGARALWSIYSSGALDQESEGERRMFREVFELGGPLPDCQVWVTRRRRADFAFLSAALVVEHLGDVHQEQVEEDTRRTRELTDAGFAMFPVVTSMIDDDPVGLVRSIHALRVRREPLVRSGALRRPVLPEQGHRRLPLRTLG